MPSVADARYIRFTNFRRSGDAVSTPVWIAPYGDEVVFSSNPTAGKVKRLRNDPRVELAASDFRGKVKKGTPIYEGTARLVAHDDPEAKDIEAAMRRKYGWQWIVIGITEALRKITRRPTGEVFLAIAVGDEVRTEP